MRRRIKGDERGVTLAELLLVLALAAILILITIPAMSTWLRSNRVRSATSLMVTHMRVVRHAAVAQSQNVSLDYGAEGTSYSFSNTNLEEINQSLPVGVTLTSASPDPLIFRSNGTLEGVTSASVQVEGPVSDGLGHRYTISVNNIGKIEVTKEEVSL